MPTTPVTLLNDFKQNLEWLTANKSTYLGQWVALRGGALVKASYNQADLLGCTDPVRKHVLYVKVKDWAKVEDHIPEIISRAAMEGLAYHDPLTLVHYADELKFTNADLSFVAEHLGLIEDPSIPFGTLQRLSTHQSPMVREGVVLGLAHHSAPESNLAVLRTMAKEDPDKLVRGLAKEALESYAN